MIRIPNMPPTSDPLLLDRHWRWAVLWTIRDLQSSMARRRTLSLPNLCRLFDRRWQQAQATPNLLGRGRELGRTFLQHYYLMHQPFHAASTPSHQHHCGG